MRLVNIYILSLDTFWVCRFSITAFIKVNAAFMLTSAIRRFVGPTIVGEIDRGIDMLNETAAVKTLPI